MDEGGLHVEVTRRRGDNAETGKEWISAAFEVIGQARDPQGNGWGKYLRWYDADGRPHTKYVGDSALHSDPGALCANLADEGLRINRGKQREFVTYLAGCRVRCRVTRVNCTGWHDVEGKRVFVLPTSTIGTAGSATVLLDAPARGQYESVGTLDEWKNSVGEAARGHILPVLAVSASFAGPLLGLIGQEGGGIHIYGRSSAGKTTLLLVAASVWGPPKFARAWRSTANGLEGASVLANDTILILDELGVIEAREAAPALYGLSNGTGKARARRDGSLREPTKWNMITLSSGEVRTETKLAEDRGRKARAGQLVRMLDIPADRGKRFGVFDHGGIGADAAEIAKHLKDTAAAVFGTAGPAFVRKIIAEGADEISQTVQEAIQNFAATNVPSGSDSQIGRAAKRLGLIAAAGELAATFGIVPWEAGEARRAATWALKAWISQRGGTEPAEENQAIEQICHFIEAHGESRFQPLDIPDAPRVINRAGWSKGKELDREWLCAPDVWKREMCAGLDPKFCATVLKKRGMLRTQSDKLQIVATIDGRSQRVYAVTHAIFEGSSDET